MHQIWKSIITLLIVQRNEEISGHFKLSEYWRKTETKTLGWSPQRQLLLSQALEYKWLIYPGITSWESVRIGESQQSLVPDRAPQKAALACCSRDTLSVFYTSKLYKGVGLSMLFYLLVPGPESFKERECHLEIKLQFWEVYPQSTNNICYSVLLS